MRDILVIRVQPSMHRWRHLGPLTAWIEGGYDEGHGQTVLAAIEDLFTAATTANVCAPLERAIAKQIGLPEKP